MRKLFYILFITTLTSVVGISYAQKKNIEDKIVCDITPDIFPLYKGGNIDAFINDIKTNVAIPKECYEYEIMGNVSLSFIVTKSGKIKNVKAEKSHLNTLTSNIQKLVENSRNWTPAMKDGKKVHYKYDINIPFSFTGDSNNRNAMFHGVNYKGFEKYIRKNLKIPVEAVAERKEGAIKIRFTVEADGRVTNFQAIESSSDILTNHLIEAVKAQGPWTPAQKDGVNISQEITISAIYELPKRLDQEPMYRTSDFSYILDHDQIIDMIKISTMRGLDMEFDWYIYSDGRCEIRNNFSSSLRALYMLQNRFEHLNWRAGKYGGKDVSVKYHINIRGGFLTYDTYILMD